jgi:hypothetical protein
MRYSNFLVRRRGLGLYETRTLLHEAGIPDEDPRQRVISTDAIRTLSQRRYPVTPGWLLGRIAVCWLGI